MTYGSLFSGIGGLDLGLERSGMSCIWQCEREPFCRKILAKHWPGVKCYEDVREINEEAETPDLLCGGFPCQPHSVAGKRKGKDDERNLWPECIRLVRLLRPRWCLFENVPGLLTTMFGQVCDELRGAGYEVWTLVLGADDVGSPHRRKRVWIICNTKHVGLSASKECRGPKSRNDRSKAGKAQARQFAGSIDAELANAGCVRDAGRRNTTTSQGMAWPSRPGEPQHEWEQPRLVYADESRSHGDISKRQSDQGRMETTIKRTSKGTKKDGSWQTQSGLGDSTHGFPRRMARRRREQLKALGNAVVPQVAEIIGRAIMQANNT